MKALNLRKHIVLFFLACFLLLAVYVSGCRRAGSWLMKEDDPGHADAIVLLMGSFTERVLQVYDEWKEGSAGRIVMVEEYMGPYAELEARGADIVSLSEQAEASLIALGIPADSITVLPGDARSTLDEALIISKYLESKKFADTILIISSPTHMRRACMIFKEVLKDFDRQIVVGCKPSTYSAFNPVKWWRRKEDIQSVVSEYIKTGSFIFLEKRKLRVN